PSPDRALGVPDTAFRGGRAALGESPQGWAHYDGAGGVRRRRDNAHRERDPREDEASRSSRGALCVFHELRIARRCAPDREGAVAFAAAPAPTSQGRSRVRVALAAWLSAARENSAPVRRGRHKPEPRDLASLPGKRP